MKGWDLIKATRCQDKVFDLMNLKVKYCYEQEKEARREYIQEKERLERAHKEKGMERKFQKIVSRIAKGSKSAWEKGVKNIRSKSNGQWIR